MGNADFEVINWYFLINQEISIKPVPKNKNDKSKLNYYYNYK